MALISPSRRLRRTLLSESVETDYHGFNADGKVTSAAQSPDFGVGIGIGMVKMTQWDPGTKIEVDTQDGMREAVVQEKFWL